MKIRCAAIVHYADGVVLVREAGAEEWRLPERELDETEDVLLCIRRCVLTQTGYRAVKVRFFKIKTQARTPKKGAMIRFIFGCEIGTNTLQDPEIEAKCFSPDEVMGLAGKNKFNDPTLLDLLHKYQAMITAPEEPDPLPLNV